MALLRRLHPPVSTVHSAPDASELPVRSNAGLIAGLALAVVSVLGIVLYYAL